MQQNFERINTRNDDLKSKGNNNTAMSNSPLKLKRSEVFLLESETGSPSRR